MNRNHVFDSSGPDLRIRGTAQQLFEKYLQLGRDATGSGDRVMAESYFQYAEHYFRIQTAMNQAAQQSGQQAHQGGMQPGNNNQNYQQGSGQQGSAQQGGQQGNTRHRDDGSDGHDARNLNERDQDDEDGENDQAVVETRPIAITAGSPE